ncbi:hypothetical protein RFM41_29900 [Mesorhizobium sp. VK25A]|uniref:Uncharacterized protein n=1 Tax=Mesorhizobium vachelliae TaxID=3072309 RepID=A0ABU5ABZ6_9HYPH|nr:MULTISPECIES: hypothetical protein [unclassified Mesorhizobium]MDX8535215.1 hypothetical protein [Mesorhizobium sp. VK25D]MDX8547991.1 hypothetical protein [Mesorhizobium sp. VK25A]
MAIKFAPKDQPAGSPATAKPARPPQKAPVEVATDLFKTPAEAPTRKTKKK